MDSKSHGLSNLTWLIPVPRDLTGAGLQVFPPYIVVDGTLRPTFTSLMVPESEDPGTELKQELNGDEKDTHQACNAACPKTNKMAAWGQSSGHGGGVTQKKKI